MAKETWAPYFDLFVAMQQKLQPLGIALGPEQYDWLCQALAQGFGWASWDGETLASWANLRRVCRVLWLKPCAHPEQAARVFNQTFDRYIDQYQGTFAPAEPEAATLPGVAPLHWPTIPPRRSPPSEAVPAGTLKAVAAVQTGAADRGSSSPTSSYHFTAQDLPLQLTQVHYRWRSLRSAERSGAATEVDIAATVAQILRQGVMATVCLRPVMQHRAELLLLVDDNAAMVPFRLAIAPLSQAVQEGWIAPAQIYRFTGYPDQYLYAAQGGRPTAIATVLSRLHPNRTVLMVVSEAGAALGIVNGARIVGTQRFIERALPCVRQLIWLNPLPSERWVGTSAQAIATTLGGRMIGLAPWAEGIAPTGGAR
jgi:uncharacterized protein